MIRRIQVAAILLLPVATVTAQGFRVPPPTNLQVLPSGTDGQDLLAVMRRFTRSLGLRCSDCHLGEEGHPLSEYDFASDERELKRVARLMMRMTRRINEDFVASLARPQALRVTCETCHRGNRRPTTLRDELAAAYADGGLDAAMARYRELYVRFFGGFTFDFRPSALDAFAAGLLEEGHARDAVDVYRFNLAEHPDHADGHAGLGSALLALGDREGARSALETALALDPQNRAARMMLSRMDGQD